MGECRIRLVWLALPVSLTLCLAGGIAAGAAQPNSSASSASAKFTPNPGHQNALNGVQTLTRNDAWAVGYYCTTGCTPLGGGKNLIIHWNGHRWLRVKSPNPGSQDQLTSISAQSGSDIWAVGSQNSNVTGLSPVILRWNGRKWTQSPADVFNLVPIATLSAVYARSASDVWAVGDHGDPFSGQSKTLVAHWNGSAWSLVSSPDPGRFGQLVGISGRSAANIWAVGQYCTARCLGASPAEHGLILHWNGRKWSKATLPVRNSAMFAAVAAVSANDAWAAGTAGKNGNPLVLHWNGKKWSKVRSPDVFPTALAFGSPRSGWGVGNGAGLMHWNGHTWRFADFGSRVADQGMFKSISARRPSDVWAVGSYCRTKCGAISPVIDTVAMQWNGHRWVRH